MRMKQMVLWIYGYYGKKFWPSTIAKTILVEFKGLNPFKLLKYSFWYCSPVFFVSVECHMVQRQLLGLREQASS
jgi:hypothetical protein